MQVLSDKRAKRAICSWRPVRHIQFKVPLVPELLIPREWTSGRVYKFKHVTIALKWTPNSWIRKVSIEPAQIVVLSIVRDIVHVNPPDIRREELRPVPLSRVGIGGGKRRARI